MGRIVKIFAGATLPRNPHDAEILNYFGIPSLRFAKNGVVPNSAGDSQALMP
jgi:hypothetical protein